MRLVVDPRDAAVRLTLAPRAALRPALVWAAGKRGWVEAQLERLPRDCPIVPGMSFLLAGQPVRLDWSLAHPRRVAFDGAALRIGGPRDQLAARTLRWLRTHAAERLAAETRELAARHDIVVGRIGVGDPKTRWGSCAASGDIRYSWRLVLAPEHVRIATIAHEVAHRVHMNHGRDFHALADRLSEGLAADASNWLRTHGATLHWFGREG